MTGTLSELTREQCWALLAGQSVGRVVYTDGALPACTPVNHLVRGRSIVFRASPRSRLAVATRDAVVAFEVDSVDPVERSGWSVLATGFAAPVEDTSTLLRLEQLNLAPWAAGDRSVWVRIVPTVVTGRLLEPMREAGARQAGLREAGLLDDADLPATALV